MPKETAHLITPVLDLRYESVKECGSGRDYHCASGPAGERDVARWDKVEKLVAQLIDNQSPPADEAVVVLLHYYVGESEAPDLITSVTARGKRMLPLLLAYRDTIPLIPGRNYPASMLTEDEIRRTEFDRAIRAVKTGRILTVD